MLEAKFGQNPLYRSIALTDSFIPQISGKSKAI